jgi:glutamate-1-semialdehyde 2,1-aminomutase/spore coat polysaccharide biosynthesis protein SpsF
MASASMRTVAVVQGRLSSTRFPRKLLADLAGEPLIVFVCRRLAACSLVDDVVVATSDHEDDTALADVVQRAGFAVHRGSLDDVLCRTVSAARSFGAQAVVRATGDCPLVDPSVLEAMLVRFRGAELSYLTNVKPPAYPDGFDLEIVSFDALESAAREALQAHEREHVTLFVRARPGRFPSAAHPCPRGDLADLHLSVDRPEQLDLVRDLIARAGTEAGFDEIMSLIDADADLAARARGDRPNDGGIQAFRRQLEAKAPRPRIACSEEWWRRAEKLIPAGTQTLSKGPTQFVRGFAPIYLARGRGSHVWDVDGNEFIDYPMGLGPVTLGHGHPVVTAAVRAQLEEGSCFSLMHPLEVQLAERVSRIVPCAEKVRFGKNGSDATAACVRAARALTGRRLIARCGYHGWQDWAIDRSYGVRARGVPDEVLDLTVAFPYNDAGALEELLKSRSFAAVVMEPVNLTPPKPGYLEAVRELTRRYGTVLVFDEVITGFRYARGGAQEHFAVVPDLAAMGKGVANGLPLSIVAGRAEYMAPFEEIFFSFTFGGETTALAAAMATLDVMEEKDYWSHVWRQGGRLQSEFRRLAREFGLQDATDCAGLPPWTIVTFADTPPWSNLQLKTLFQQEMIRRGVLFSGSQFISLAHDDADIARTIEAYRDALQVLRFALDFRAVDALTEGRVNETIFHRG